MGAPHGRLHPASDTRAQFEHIVELFDSPESLGEAVARYFVDGLSSGDNLLIVAKAVHVQAVADAMNRRGLAVATLIDAGRLVILDAATTLRLIMKRGIPDSHALHTVAENAVDHLAANGQQVRIYGELVEILAEEGNFRGAELVEEFWNAFGATHAISLLCGYSSAHFVMPGSLASLESICHAHSRVQQNRQDLLANWLLSRRAQA